MLSSDVQQALGSVTEKLKASLSENLHSVVLYGSAVRGNWVKGVSDINLLLILEESTPEAHTAIADCIDGTTSIAPFILGCAGMERSFQAFALKFRSIQRHYMLLHGSDPFTLFKVNDAVLRFLCEQSVRNMRLRLVRAFVVERKDTARYQRYVLGLIPNLMTDLGEVLRCTGMEIPVEFSKRVAIFQNTFKSDASVLSALLQLKQEPRKLTATEVGTIHAQLHTLLNQVIVWMESQWPRLETPISG